MSLGRLQRRLQDIYELSVAEDVDDFLITDPRVAAALCGEPAPRDCRERLLLREDADGLDVTLYVDSAVIDSLGRAGDGSEGYIGDLHGFCQALEGVSHFLYLVWHASRERSVSLLEMELQAEVDKYVLIRELLADAGCKAPELIPRLFRSVAYCRDLEPAEQRRYRAASRCAERYCRRLESRYCGAESRRALLNELRRFYRMPGRDKVHAAASTS
jgi:hypothetical protein